ncbi:minor tail protein [Mycobacterium phage SirPhilip]|uniref:Minor tail protein n=1 Tax=Mycobacterium phage SirPhilip TaxID=2015824 RepID=A0A222ZL91_9CAUD|nr:minor tail protein [Mycobacterium phage SirPhilip]ASR85228.1 minor tail protein [Mycobacterium phage SirPhilip]
MPPVFDRRQLSTDRDPMRSIFGEPAKLPKLDAGALWAQWLDGFKTLTGIDLSSPQALVLSLGDLIGDVFDPAKIADLMGQVLGYVGGPLTGAAALAKWASDQLFGLIDPSRLPLLPVGHVTQAAPNLLTNGAFADTVSIDDPAERWTLDSTVGRTTPGSALTLADGTIRELLSVDLIPVTPGEKLDIEGYVKRANVTGSNGSVYLGLTAYADTKGAAQATEAPNRPTIALLSSVTGTADWTKLSGTYKVPATGVASVRLRLAVTNGATAGSLWFDDLKASKGTNLLHIDFVDGLSDELAGAWAAISGAIEDIGDRLGLDQWQAFLDAAAGGVGGTIHSIIDRIVHLGLDGTFDASQLINVKNIPTLPNLVMEGINGISNIGESIQGTIDYLWSALTGGGKATGKSLAALAQAAQQTSTDITNAVHLAQLHANILNERRNKPAYIGLADTVEATFVLMDIAPGATPPSIAVTQSNTLMGFLRCGEAADKGFVQWLGNGNAGITGFYVNVYRMDTSTGDLALLHTSPNLQTQLTATWAWQTYLFSGSNQTAVLPGDVLVAEFVVVGSGTYLVAGMPSTWVPPHPTALPKRLGGQRSSPSVASPPTILAASVPYTAVVPWVGFGISNVPPGYEPPTTTEYNGAQTVTYQVPLWANYVDVIAIGGGGAGGSSVGPTTGQGGNHGEWVTATLVRGVDFPVDATTIAVTVGKGGSGSPYLSWGANGAATVITYTDPGGVVRTLSAAGGPGGGAGPAHNPANPNGGTNGNGSPNFTYRGITYFGGNDVTYAGGSAPGGGGAGGFVYLPGSPGGSGAAYLVARQSVDD